MKNLIPFLLTILIPMSLIRCKGNASKNNREKLAKDTTHVLKIATQIAAAKPVFKGYKFYSLTTQQDTTYIRSVSNTKSLKKVWIVYYDKTIDNWTVKTWIDSGENNKVFGDTILTRKSMGHGPIGDVIDFYMASSTNNGKTWTSYDPSPAHLYCQGNPRLSNEVQLLVSNDFLNPEHIPSLGIMIQWKHPYIINGIGITSHINWTNYCKVTRKIDRR